MNIPSSWAVCYNDGCPMASECLRRHICKTALQGETKWNCILPSALENGNCKYFRKIEIVRMARGLNATFSKLKDKQVRHKLRIDLTNYFGSQGSYYRYKDGERWINPQLQKMIADMLKSYGCNQEPVFDEYVEGYDFTNHRSEEGTDEKSQ